MIPTRRRQWQGRRRGRGRARQGRRSRSGCRRRRQVFRRGARDLPPDHARHFFLLDLDDALGAVDALDLLLHELLAAVEVALVAVAAAIAAGVAATAVAVAAATQTALAALARRHAEVVRL